MSSSGSTVFIEPLAVFEFNNELNNLKIDESAEIERILYNLSSMLFAYTTEIRLDVSIIGKLDFIFAKAKYSNSIKGITLGGDHAKIDAWRGEQSRTRTRLRRPELYEQWCTSHPIAEVPKWKRGENVRLVKTAEQFAAAAKLFAEGRQAVCADNWTPEYCRALTEPQFLLQLQQEKAAGWVCYLHTTKDVPDGMVCVSHKAGHIEHLFVTEKARGNGIGAKLLDFARKKLPEHAHPVLSVLNTNTRAIALYTRMGWQLDGSTSLEFDPQQYPTVTRKCALVQMRYAGPAQE